MCCCDINLVMPSWLHWILAITICSSGGLALNSISRDVLCQEKEAANTTRACKESGRRKLRALKGPQKEIIDVGVDESLHSPWDQRLALYFSNPRAVSLLVTPRASKYGSRRLVYEPRTDSKVRPAEFTDTRKTLLFAFLFQKWLAIT